MKSENVIREAAQQFTTELFVLLKSMGIDILSIPSQAIGESLGRFAYKCYLAGLDEGRQVANMENRGLFAPFQITKDKNDPKADN